MNTRLFAGWPFRRKSAAGGRLRMMVMSTPRSGNTWLRRLLTKAYRLDEHARGELWAHTPEGFPWADLPERCAMQLHWHPTAEFRALLKAHDVRVVTIARHPLDGLVSVLQLCRHSHETPFWLQAEGGDEVGIRTASPNSEAFLEYATGPRAAALLSVSLEWKGVRGAEFVRYEDFVDDAFGSLTRLTRALQPISSTEVQRAVQACTLQQLRIEQNPAHFWQGQPGLWKRLLTAETARAIASAHAGVFKKLKYACDPDASLTREQAEGLWASLTSRSAAA